MEKTKLIEYLESIEETDGYEPKYFNTYMRLNPETLKEFDEFKHVTKINVVKTPIFLVDSVTNEPLESMEDYIGQNNKPIISETHIVDFEKQEFNEVIDILHIGVTPKIYDQTVIDKLGCGIWLYPTSYSPIDFQSTSRIDVKYSLDSICQVKNIGTAQAKEEAKKTILAKVAELIDSGVPNVPYTRKIMVRCSPRSIRNKN